VKYGKLNLLEPSGSVHGLLFCTLLLLIIKNCGSRVTVRVGNQFTPTFPITNGVRQGDALSSIIFYLVLEAIIRKLNNTGHIGTKTTQIFAYADDVATLSRNKMR